MLAVRPGSGDVTRTHIDWSSRKGVPNRSSPLLLSHGKMLYMVNSGGIASCVEVETGRQVWQERLPGQFWASPVAAEGRLYFFNDSGTTYVAAAGQKSWKQLAVNKLDDGCMGSPAVAGKSLFIRTKTHLYRVEKKE
jgi:outer membrane protein assembly factor BamB